MNHLQEMSDSESEELEMPQEHRKCQVQQQELYQIQKVKQQYMNRENAPTTTDDESEELVMPEDHRKRQFQRRHHHNKSTASSSSIYKFSTNNYNTYHNTSTNISLLSLPQQNSSQTQQCMFKHQHHVQQLQKIQREIEQQIDDGEKQELTHKRTQLRNQPWLQHHLTRTLNFFNQNNTN
jgi:hypothetical protein